MNLKDLPEAREVVFVFLSLPPTALYQNRVESSHWRTRQKAAREARAEAWARALYMHPSDWRRNGSRMFAQPFETCEIEIAVTVPDRRRRDLNGILSAVKSWLDGLVDAGVFPDDDYTHVQRLSATVTYVKGVSETRIIVRER